MEETTEASIKRTDMSIDDDPDSDRQFNSTMEISEESDLNQSQRQILNFEQSALYVELTMETLPSELILHICSFLDAKFLISTFSCICKHFNSMLKDDRFWKIRIGKRWPKKYPAVPVNSAQFDWKQACMEREEAHRRWYDHLDNTEFFSFSVGMFAPVDSVHFVGPGCFLAAGSRDRYLNVLDLSKLETDNPDSVNACRVFTKMDAHKGWIWSLSSQDSILATGSWDKYIKFWDLEAEGQEIRKIQCKSAVLCTHFEPHFFVAGSYDKKIYHIDPRTPTILAEKRYHSKPVLDLAADDSYIVTASEDGSVCVYDRRADRVLHTIPLPNTTNTNSYPMSLSLGSDQLWVGDRGGAIHLYDATDGDFTLVDTYDVGHTGKVTGIIHTTGALYTCSTDKTIRVLEPSLNPATIATLTQHKADVAEISYQNGILASACSDVSIGIWRPRDL